MIYADYSFYTGKFMGAAIGKSDFPRLALRASQLIDYYTMNRAKDYTKDDAVKTACCAIAEACQRVEQNEAKANISSESVGSYSVSYTTNKDAKTELFDEARRHLMLTGLLYRGGGC